MLGSPDEGDLYGHLMKETYLPPDKGDSKHVGVLFSIPYKLGVIFMKNFIIGFMLGVWFGPIGKEVVRKMAERELSRQEKAA